MGVCNIGGKSLNRLLKGFVLLPLIDRIRLMVYTYKLN